MDSPYSLLSLKGSVIRLVTSKAKLVFSVCMADRRRWPLTVKMPLVFSVTTSP